MNKKIYLFGAGGAASWILAGFQREGINISGFLDDNAFKIKNVCGIPVYNPADPIFSKNDKDDSVVVFCIMSPTVDESDIKTKLFDLGWNNYYTFSEFGKLLYKTLNVRCSMIDPVYIENNLSGLDLVYNILSDNKSKQILNAFVNFVLTLDDSLFPEIDKDIYFPKDLKNWDNPLRFIDCGGYNGDSIHGAIDAGYIIENCISFEPDPINFSYLSKMAKEIPNIIASPCGVLDSTKIIKFRMQEDMGSSINNDGDISVQCVSLDDMIPSFAPNFIKMDIEGSEQNALFGAYELIKKYKPGLAISVYHTSSDIFKIPIYLYELYGDSCEYYLRNHSRTIADTVLYIKSKK